MDVTIRANGRTYRISVWGSPAEGWLSSEIDRELAGVSSGLGAGDIRSFLEDAGYAVAGDDVELRALLRSLLDAGRLRVSEVVAPVAPPEESDEDEEKAELDEPAEKADAAAAPAHPAMAAPTPAAVRGVVPPAAAPAAAPAPPPAAPAPATKDQKYKLIELVEVVDRGGLGTVAGAAKGSALLPKHVDRTEKDGAAFKQFINLGKDIDGVATRHPENGRFIDLRARIEWTSGDKSLPLSGKKVKWKVTLVPHSGAGRPAAFAVAAEKDGIGGTNDKHEETTSTDANGWAGIRLHLSQYAGDELSVSAELDTSDGQATAGAAIKAGPYKVWRKFWYQTTKPDASTVPAPSKAVAAYKAIHADMLAADTVKFKSTDVPAPPSGTFYPKGMATVGSAVATEIALIGGHNRASFWAKFNAEATRPVKAHLIICDGQWDPSGASPVQLFEMKAKAQELKFDLGTWNAGILKPALTGVAVVRGEWFLDLATTLRYAAADARGICDASLPPKPASFSGNIGDADIGIPLPRTDLSKITVTLPAACPDPTKYKIFVTLKATFGKYYGGEREGVNMLIVHRAGGDTAYHQAVSHEIGHGWKMVPDKTNTLSLPNHANAYKTSDGHGGQGPHCSTGATKDAVTTQYTGGLFRDGTCIMFHQLSPTTCTQTFCASCEPHLRLQSFHSLA